jgi:hypothetical protein
MSKVKATLTRPVPVTPPATVKVELELSEREAEAVLALTRRVGGCPSNSARSVFDVLREALMTAGVKYNQDRPGSGGSPLEGSRSGIYFRDYSEYAQEPKV